MTVYTADAEEIGKRIDRALGLTLPGWAAEARSNECRLG